MSEPTHKAQTNHVHESAFGGSANWWAAWPAAAVGLTAFLLAVYGTFWLPRQLPMQYTRALERTQQLYQQLTERASSGGSERLVDAAGDMDVIYSRLVGLEGNSPERYWQWAEFQRAHADRLNSILQDPAVSLSPAVRQRWAEQAEHFRAKSHEILDQLTLRPSQLQARSVLQVAQRKYRTGLGEFGVREAGSLAESLTNMLTAGESDDGRQPELTRQEIQAARLLAIQLHIEAAWQSPAGSSLTCNPQRLETAWQLLEKFYPQPASEMDETTPWRATRGLLAAMTGRERDEAPTGDGQDENAAQATDTASWADSAGSWDEELARLQLAALDNDWSGVARQLGYRGGQLEPAVTSGLARTVCRLIVSPPASGTEQTDLGALLAAQLAPQLPETSELLWECARSQAGQGSEHVRVPDSVAQSIMAGQSAWLKHSLAAISATLDDKPSVARTHLQLLGRAQSNASLVARVALWRSQMLAVPDTVVDGDLHATEEASLGVLADEESRRRELDKLIELLGTVVQLEPKSGLNWFVLGTLQFRAGEFDEMQSSLTKAQELLGEVPAIEQMLQAAGR